MAAATSGRSTAGTQAERSARSHESVGDSFDVCRSIACSEIEGVAAPRRWTTTTRFLRTAVGGASVAAEEGLMMCKHKT